MVGVAGEEIAYSTVLYNIELTKQTTGPVHHLLHFFLLPGNQTIQPGPERNRVVGRLFGRVGLIVVAKLTPPEHIYLPLSCYSHDLPFDPVHPFLYFCQPNPFYTFLFKCKLLGDHFL